MRAGAGTVNSTAAMATTTDSTATVDTAATVPVDGAPLPTSASAMFAHTATHTHPRYSPNVPSTSTFDAVVDCIDQIERKEAGKAA